MKRVFFPKKDAAIYAEFPSRNTGLDEQLEVGKSLHGSRAARSLLQFDMADIRAVGVPINAIYNLVLSVSFAANLQDNQVIEICPVSESWLAGTGYFYQDIVSTTDGVTWNSRVTGSAWVTSGSTFLPSPTASLILPNPMTDLSVDITSLIQYWLSGSANNGMVVKFASGSEADNSNRGIIRIFSNDTHTIYRPAIVASWNDQNYVTGSLPAAPIDGLIVTPSSLRPVYQVSEVVRVNLAARQQYPVKTFGTLMTTFSGVNYLPSSSYFSVVDDQAGTIIIPFSDSSLVSCDAAGSYIKFAIENMYPRRFYRLLIRVDANGYSQIFDTAALFTVR